VAELLPFISKKDVLLFMTCGISYGTVGHQTSGAGSNPYFLSPGAPERRGGQSTTLQSFAQVIKY
jgi:hypothetical protein